MSKHTSPEPQLKPRGESAAAAPCLAARGVVAGYGSTPIVHDIELTVPTGSIVCIIGPNGAGKSTFLKAVAGFVRVFQGSFLLYGEEVARQPPEALARRGIGFVPQTRKIFPSLNVSENLDMGAFLHPRQHGERLAAVLELFPVLKERMRQRAGLLSGGEQTMLAIGRAMMASPRLLLLDEPTAALSPASTQEVWGHIRRLKATGTTMLIVEQRTREVLSIADWAYILVGGRNALDGAASKIAEREDLGRIFLQAR